VGAGIWAIFLRQSGAHLDPKGSILKVRTVKLDDTNSAAVIELRLTNDADYPLVARTIEASAVAKSGEAPGNVVAEVDVKDLYKNFPALGEQFNPVMKARDKVPPRSTIDREVCATFGIPVEELDQRKDLVVRIQDISGPTLEMHGKSR
jgi:hypothetical protein